MESTGLPTLGFNGAVSFVAVWRVVHCEYVMHVLALICFLLPFLLVSHNSVLQFHFLYCSSFCFSYLFYFSVIHFHVMYLNANSANFYLAVTSSRFEEASNGGDSNDAKDTFVTNTDNDREVSSWFVAECKTCYADTLDARRFSETFSDGANSFIFDCLNTGRDTDIGGRDPRRFPGTLRDMLGFEMPIVRHAMDVDYLHHLLRLVRNVVVTPEFRDLNLCYFEHPIDGFYLVKDTDALCRGLEFDGR